MAMHNPQLRSLPRLFQTLNISKQCIRPLHRKAAPSVPAPTPFVPDVQTFLTLIGREMSKHASKISSWDQLFASNSDQLRELGIEPARQRRYLMRKREKFRNGVYGPGGDLEQVVDGVAQLRVVEVPRESDSAAAGASSATLTPGMKKAIVNLAPDATEYKHSMSAELKKFAHMKIHRGSKIMGPFLQPIKGSHGSAATISVQEGMWEDKRGVKVDGGERRRVEVRAKKRLEERRKA
ncbi:telomere length regulation protein [Penicillium ochrochloron]